MGKVTAMRIQSEPAVQPDFSAIVDAAQSEPVFIDRGDREVAVVLSAQEYESLRQSAVNELLQLCDEISERAAVRGMTEEILQELLADG